MLLDIIIAVALFIAGSLLYAFGGLQILVSIFCAFPFTARLKKRYGGEVAAGAIRMKLIYTVVIWAVVFAAATLAVIGWGPEYSLFGYLGGILMNLAISIGKLGINEANVGAYISRYEKFLTPKLRDELIAKLADGSYKDI